MSRAVSIVVVCGAGYVSGKEIMAIELGRGLADAGHCIHFAASSWNNGDFSDRLKLHELKFEVMPLGFISARMDPRNLKMTGEQVALWPRLVWTYRKMLLRERPSVVVHTNWHHLLLLWPYLNPARDLFWLHEVLPDTRRHRRFVTRLSRRIAKFICVSNAVADSLMRLGVPQQQAVVVHNGLEDPSQGILKTGQVLQTTLRIGIVGQIGVWKGHQDVVEAIALALRNDCDVHLSVFGQGDERFVAQLKKTAVDLGIAGNVSWHGFERNRANIYNQLDVCVVPSRSHDPLPTTAIEAGYFGLPVIATSQGGLPEIVQDGETGYLVEAEAPRQIADALCKFANRPDLLKQMGQAARVRMLQKFGRDRFIAEFMDVIDHTVATSVGRRF
jgi:glycosyltransferase involved in cell wall biosynthesis